MILAVGAATTLFTQPAHLCFKVASFSVPSRSPRSRLNYTPLGNPHPTCSFLCCETGLSVYQPLDAPALNAYFHSRLPLVYDLQLLNTCIDCVNTPSMSTMFSSSGLPILRAARSCFASNLNSSSEAQQHTGTMHPFHVLQIVIPTRSHDNMNAQLVL